MEVECIICGFVVCSHTGSGICKCKVVSSTNSNINNLEESNTSVHGNVYKVQYMYTSRILKYFHYFEFLEPHLLCKWSIVNVLVFMVLGSLGRGMRNCYECVR